jgi:PAS domain S-box-containing protein
MMDNLEPNRPLALLVPYLLSAAIPLALGLFVRFRSRTRVSSSFSAFLFQDALWGLVSVLELVSVSGQAKLFWDNMQFLVGGCVAVAVLSFSCRFGGTWFKRGRVGYAMLLAAPAAVWLFLVTNPLHGLAMRPRPIEPGALWGGYGFRYTAPTFVLAGLLMAIALAGILRLGILAAKDLRRGRIGGIIVFLGLVLALSGSVLAIYGPSVLGKWVSGPLNVPTLWLGAGDIIVTIGVLRFRLFGFLPVARRLLVEELGSPVLVIDSEGLLVDANEAFAVLVGTRRGAAIGKPVSELLRDWPTQAREALESEEARVEASIGEGEAERRFEISVTPVLESPAGDSRGKVAVFQDVTRLKAAERRLIAMNSELELRVEARTRELEREVSRRAAAEALLLDLNAEILSTQREIMLTLSEVVETRSKETAHHVLRVGEYTRILAAAMGLAPENVSLMADASPLHDIGKIGVPDAILQKTGALTEEERLLMQNHTTIGHEILRKSDRSLIRAASVIALDHHENWDGSGYPAGKAGKAISLSGRIVRVCDVFDALLTTRSYKPAWSMAVTLEYFRKERARLFDPELLDIVFLNIDRFLKVAELYPDQEPASGEAEAVLY